MLIFDSELPSKDQKRYDLAFSDLIDKHFS